MPELIKSVDKVACLIFHLLHVGLTAEFEPMRAREAHTTNGGDR